MVKQIIRQRLAKIAGNDIQKISELNYNAADVISFDLFDTLVFRNCSNPADIFAIVEKKFDKEYGKKSYFYCKRIEAQEKACSTIKHEISLEDIYNSFEGIEQNELIILKELEKNAEYDFIAPNDDMIALFRELVDSGKKVIITTDMYLPIAFIEKILNKCNISGYDKVFLSCKEGKSKRKGDLFEIISSTYHVNYSGIIHIGDNYMADYYIPRKLGINCALYKRSINGKQICGYRRLGSDKQNSIDASILESVAEKTCKYEDLNYVVGNRVLGPILAGYSTWLYEYVKKENISNIVFLSREGYIMKKAFDCLYSEDRDIVTNYINISRLAVLRCIAGEAKDYDELMGLFSGFIDGIKTVFDFHQILVGSKAKTEDILFADSEVDKLDSSQKKQIFEQINELYLGYFTSQKVLFKEYLFTNGFDQPYLALADIGWSGTMQKYLQRFLPNAKIVGNYLAVWDRRNAEYYKSIERRGFFFGPEEWETDGQIFRFTMPAIETLFMNKEGTTLGYERKDGHVFPVKEYNVWEEIPLKAIERVHDGTIDFLEGYYKSNINYWCKGVNSKVFLKNYYDFVVCPNHYTIVFYGQFEFEHGMRKYKLEQ